MTISEAAPAPSGLATRIPLSLNQEFLCAFDKGADEGAFSDRHTLVYGWRIRGKVDTGTLQAALDDVVARHEALRTSIVRGTDERHQIVHPPSPVTLVVRDLSGTDPADRDARAEALVNELDAGRYSVRELPHLRAVLGAFDDTDAVLVLIVHHTATDSWSMQLTMRDLAARYAARRDLATGELPEACQYREFAVWQMSTVTGDGLAAARDYWRRKLAGAQILALPTDRPKTDGVPNSFAIHRFEIDAELTGATLRLANALRSSPFMILMAAYKVLLHAKSGATDIVVPTFTSGRYEDRFLDSVGVFFNFLPLRTDIAGCRHFRDVVERVRRTCIEAYSQDIPFPMIANETPELVAPFADPGLAVFAFELLQSSASMDHERVGDLTYSEVRRRLQSQPVASDIPDGALWALDVLPTGGMVGSLKFNTNLYDERTAVDLVADLRLVLRNVVTAPDAPLTQAVAGVSKAASAR